MSRTGSSPEDRRFPATPCQQADGAALALVVLAALFCMAEAHAGRLIDYIRDYDLNNYALGLAVSSSQNPYAGAGSSVLAYPYLTSFRHSAFTDDWLLIRDENIGFRYVTQNDWEIGLVGRVQTLGLGNSDLSSILEERAWAIEAGPLIGWRGWPIHAQFRSYWEIPNRHSCLLYTSPSPRD